MTTSTTKSTDLTILEENLVAQMFKIVSRKMKTSKTEIIGKHQTMGAIRGKKIGIKLLYKTGMNIQKIANVFKVEPSDVISFNNHMNVSSTFLMEKYNYCETEFLKFKMKAQRKA